MKSKKSGVIRRVKTGWLPKVVGSGQRPHSENFSNSYPFIYRIHLTKPNQTKPNQTKPNQTKPNQTKPNQTYTNLIKQ